MTPLKEGREKKSISKLLIRAAVVFAVAVILFFAGGIAYLLITGQSIDFGSGDEGFVISLEKVDRDDVMGPEGSDMVLQFKSSATDEQISGFIEKYKISTWAYDSMFEGGYNWFRSQDNLDTDEFKSLVVSLKQEELIARVITREEFLSECDYPEDGVIGHDSSTSLDRVSQLIFNPLILLVLSVGWAFIARSYSIVGFRQLLSPRVWLLWIVTLLIAIPLGFHLFHLVTCPMCWIWTIPLTAIVWLIIAFGLRLTWKGKKQDFAEDKLAGGTDVEGEGEDLEWTHSPNKPEDVDDVKEGC